MTLFESLRTSLQALASNKLRSILTMLGIIIGVGAVIALSSLGQGVETMVSDTIQDIGSNVIYVQPYQHEDATRIAQLSMADAIALGDTFDVPAAAAVAAQSSGSLRVTRGDRAATLTVTGSTFALADISNLQTVLGGFLTEADLLDRARVAVLGDEAYEELYGEDEYPIDTTITIDGTRFRVVGVLEAKGGMLNHDRTIYVPITTAQQRLFPARTLSGDHVVQTILVQAASEELADAAVEQVKATLREAHDLSLDAEDDFRVTSQKEILDMSSEVTGVITTFLSVVAGISLLVGGIGIMNIMLVTVTERTREIGIRKAIGATRWAILVQFLVEAVVLTVTGGILGSVLGTASSQVLAQLIDITPEITVTMFVLAGGISSAVGVIFGVYPALRAANLRPIEALRHE